MAEWRGRVVERTKTYSMAEETERHKAKIYSHIFFLTASLFMLLFIREMKIRNPPSSRQVRYSVPVSLSPSVSARVTGYYGVRFMEKRGREQNWRKKKKKRKGRVGGGRPAAPTRCGRTLRKLRDFCKFDKDSADSGAHATTLHPERQADCWYVCKGSRLKMAPKIWIALVQNKQILLPSRISLWVQKSATLVSVSNCSQIHCVSKNTGHGEMWGSWEKRKIYHMFGGLTRRHRRHDDKLNLCPVSCTRNLEKKNTLYWTAKLKSLLRGFCHQDSPFPPIKVFVLLQTIQFSDLTTRNIQVVHLTIDTLDCLCQ